MTNLNLDTKTNALVVSQERSVIETAKECLSARRFNVLHSPAGPDALELLKKRSVRFMLTDMNLPEMPGVLVAQIAARMFPDICIVLATAKENMEQARAAMGSGVSDYITKPLELKTLETVIDRNIQRRQIESKQLCQERSRVLFSAIKALAAAIDAKSYFTATHSSRVTSMCMTAGKLMQLNENDMANLELAAQLHDIGKIGTPDEILDKPSALTDMEWVDILRHPDVGSSILSHIPSLTQVASVVRHHHERYDGTGYPDGLSGEAIPLLSRLIAIADAYEAMTADRPYRPARTHSDTVAELRANSRKQFDPMILECFIAAIDDMVASSKAA
jgi:putative two-component system response regulator